MAHVKSKPTPVILFENVSISTIFRDDDKIWIKTSYANATCFDTGVNLCFASNYPVYVLPKDEIVTVHN